VGDEIETLREGAKAIQEVAKATGKVVDAGRGAGGWLDRIFGNGIEHAVARRWSDREMTKRIEAAILDWERLELLVQKVEKRLKDKGITRTRLPPPKIMLPLIEHATMEYEDDLHTLWANLLTTALDDDGDQVHRKYVSTLAELSTDDARALEAIFLEWQKLDRDKWSRGGGSVSYGPSVEAPTNADVSMSILFSLGLVFPSLVGFETYEPRGHARWGDYGPSREALSLPGDLSTVVLTEFGEAFCVAALP
jgi:Abortive infection alpha